MVLGELGGVAREATRDEDRVLSEGLELVELVLGRFPIFVQKLGHISVNI